MKDVLGALMDEGYSPQEARELMGPLAAEMDADDDLSSQHLDPSGRQQALHDILRQARDERQPPGPQAVAAQGLVRALPNARKAAPVRVDTEESYQLFRASGQDDVEALSTAAEDELLGERVGDIMDMQPASQTSLIGVDQSCLLCGTPTGGSVVCGACKDRMPAIIGLFDRGYASQDIVGFGERGSAASLYDDNPSATLGADDDFYRLQRTVEESALVGDDPFYRLERTDEESALIGEDFYRRISELSTVNGMYRRPAEMSVVGMDNFYRMSRMSLEEGGLSALLGNVMALAVPSTVYAEEVPLSFNRLDQHQNVSAWKQGAHVYGSIRVTGWDGQPRILTAATPYAKEVGIVVGYAASAHIAPSHTLAVLDPLARQLGASRLIPRLAAAAPPVLRITSDKVTPLIVTAMPVRE
jgi:hypothetical protein